MQSLTVLTGSKIATFSDRLLFNLARKRFHYACLSNNENKDITFCNSDDKQT